MPAIIKIHPDAIGFSLFDNHIEIEKATEINEDGSITFVLADEILASGEYDVIITPVPEQSQYQVLPRTAYGLNLVPKVNDYD